MFEFDVVQLGERMILHYTFKPLECWSGGKVSSPEALVSHNLNMGNNHRVLFPNWNMKWRDFFAFATLS